MLIVPSVSRRTVKGTIHVVVIGVGRRGVGRDNGPRQRQSFRLAARSEGSMLGGIIAPLVDLLPLSAPRPVVLLHEWARRPDGLW